jgi:hypothetical protein
VWCYQGQRRICKYLTGGDAEVAIWERLWAKHRFRPEWLQYHILLSPHHCSWHSLSYDSWGDLGERAKVSPDARNALGQALHGAAIISSSKPVRDDDSDPPCIRAKREYQSIITPARRFFICTVEHPSERNPDVLEFEIGRDGPRLAARTMRTSAISGAGAIGGQPLPHGEAE